MDSRRKYWGPFSPVPQPPGPYMRVIYPCNEGLIEEDDGQVRELGPQELDYEIECTLDCVSSQSE